MSDLSSGSIEALLGVIADVEDFRQEMDGTDRRWDTEKALRALALAVSDRTLKIGAVDALAQAIASYVAMLPPKSTEPGQYQQARGCVNTLNESPVSKRLKRVDL